MFWWPGAPHTQIDAGKKKGATRFWHHTKLTVWFERVCVCVWLLKLLVPQTAVSGLNLLSEIRFSCRVHFFFSVFFSQHEKRKINERKFNFRYELKTHATRLERRRMGRVCKTWKCLHLYCSAMGKMKFSLESIPARSEVFENRFVIVGPESNEISSAKGSRIKFGSGIGIGYGVLENWVQSRICLHHQNRHWNRSQFRYLRKNRCLGS